MHIPSSYYYAPSTRQFHVRLTVSAFPPPQLASGCTHSHQRLVPPCPPISAVGHHVYSRIYFNSCYTMELDVNITVGPLGAGTCMGRSKSQLRAGWWHRQKGRHHAGASAKGKIESAKHQLKSFSESRAGEKGPGMLVGGKAAGRIGVAVSSGT